MTKRNTIIEYIPIFDGEQSFKDLLLSIIVEKILSKTDENPLPKGNGISYNDGSVPLISGVPGLCEGES